MKFFLDTANLDEIKKAADMGVISGVTTNPSLIAREGREQAEQIKRIAALMEPLNGLVNAEVNAFTEDSEGMIREAREIAALHPCMVVKIPMTAEGLKAVRVLSAEGIRTTVTLVFSANQALMAAEAGAAYVAPFIGRLDDIDLHGTDLIRTIKEIFRQGGYETKIIAASVRNPLHVTECALAGADIATMPFSVVQSMVKHPLTDAGLARFKKDYAAAFGSPETSNS